MPPITSSIGVTVPPAGLGSFLVVGIPIGSYVFTTDLDPFDADPITDAGRMQPRGVVPANGSFVFCLGHDGQGFPAFFSPGDYAEVTQTGTFPPGNVLTFQARTRAPTGALPAGFSWVASVLLDGGEVGRRTLGLHAPVDWDWAVDVASTSVVPHSISFRLSLLGPALVPPALPVVELEVPAFYVDNLQFFAATAPFITNEVPVNGQGEGMGPAPLDSTSIDFDVFGLGVLVDVSSVHVVVNSVGAIVGGVVQAGFTGSVGTNAEVVHVTVAPVGGFASAQTVTVQATVALIGGAHSTRTWSFEVADSTPPLMAMVQALTPKQLRVTWTKAIALVDPSAAHDGLNPSLYLLQAIQPDSSTPAVRGHSDPELSPIVASVEVVSFGPPSVIDLVTDVETTPGVDYTVTALGVEDLVGNYTTSTFEMPGFVLPWPKGRVFDLMRWLPRMNRVEDVTRDLLRFVRCLQEPASLLLYDIDNWTDILDVDRAPEPMLDAMLADLGNPFPFVLTVIQKRQLVRLLNPIYQQKGTGVGIINAIRFFLGITVTITSFTGGTMELGVSELGGDSVPLESDPSRLGSWVLGPGNSFALYCFRVVSPVALSPAQIEQIRFIANYMKPGHTHLIEIVVPTTPTVYDPAELGISELGSDWLLHL